MIRELVAFASSLRSPSAVATAAAATTTTSQRCCCWSHSLLTSRSLHEHQPSSSSASSSTTSNSMMALSAATTTVVYHHHPDVEPVVVEDDEHEDDSSFVSSASRVSSTGQLMLEGDVFAVSHDGIARTCYHLTSGSSAAAEYRTTTTAARRPLSLAIEECYDLQRAHKTFLVREMKQDDDTDENVITTVLGKQTLGLAPMGRRVLGSVDIQEIDHGDTPLFESAAGTGGTTWEASVAMALYFAAQGHQPSQSLLSGKVIELGCGVGLGGILTQIMGPLLMDIDAADGEENQKSSSSSRNTITSVTLTDGNEQVLKECRHNIQSALNSLAAASSRSSSNNNKMLPPVFVKHLDWNNNIADDDRHSYDSVLACDVAYLYTDVVPLCKAMVELLDDDKQQQSDEKSNNNAKKIHLFGPYNRGALQQVCVYLREELDMHVELEFVEMDRYRLKPDNNKKSKTRINQHQHHQHHHQPFAFSSQWWRGNHDTTKTTTTTATLSSLMDPEEEDQRAYASKSTAKFLHITASHKRTSDKKRSANESSLEDID